MWNDVKTGKSLDPIEDESIDEFMTRRFSASFAANLVDPMISGIYAGDTSKLSIQSVFPMLKRLELQHGSILRGAIQEAFKHPPAKPNEPDSPFVKGARKVASVSFKRGMSTFPEALADGIKVNLCCEYNC